MAIDTTAAASEPFRSGPPPVAPDLPRAQAGQGEFSFWDLLDIVNPLQHIPLVNTVYREVTGDTITGAARILGGALFGGVFGAFAGAVGAIVQEATGRDPGEHMMAWFDGGDDAATPTAVAGAAAGTGAPASRQAEAGTAAPVSEAEAVLALAAAAAPTRRGVARPAEASAPTVPPAGAGAAPSWPPGGAAPLPPELIADAMMAALDKYEQSRRTARP